MEGDGFTSVDSRQTYALLTFFFFGFGDLMDHPL